ncbi:MAG: hypothetical protein K2P46_04315, partial [Alistipes sp.]|nr:hypothetical protein [Alistipes sp.]
KKQACHKATRRIARFGDRSGLRRSRLRQVCERPRSRPADHWISDQAAPRSRVSVSNKVRRHTEKSGAFHQEKPAPLIVSGVPIPESARDIVISEYLLIFVTKKHLMCPGRAYKRHILR